MTKTLSFNEDELLILITLCTRDLNGSGHTKDSDSQLLALMQKLVR